jgi:hypothetical protein
MRRTWTGSAWGPWQDTGHLLSSSPSAVASSETRIDVVSRNAEGELQDYYWNGSTWQKLTFEGQIQGSPDIASWEPGRLDVFAKGIDNSLIHKSYTTASGWSAWENLGHTIASSPGVVSWGPGRLDVIAKQIDDRIHHWWYGS